MANLILFERLLRIVICIVVIVSLSVLIYQSLTANRWQEKAINNYNAAILSNQKPEHLPEVWWTENPFIVGLRVWFFDVNNLISIFFGVLSFLVKQFIVKLHILKYFHFSK